MKPGMEARADVFAAKMRNFAEHCLYEKPTLAPAKHGPRTLEPRGASPTR